MSERAQLERLLDAADSARATMLLAYDELIFGGNWEVARARIAESGERLEKVMTTVERTLGRTQPRLSFAACLELRK